MTHDIPRFGTPDGGLTWASTGTHHGGGRSLHSNSRGRLGPNGPSHPARGDQFGRLDPAVSAISETIRSADPSEYWRPGYLDGDEGLTWAEQVARRDAEIERLRAELEHWTSSGTSTAPRPAEDVIAAMAQAMHDTNTASRNDLARAAYAVAVDEIVTAGWERLAAEQERDAARAELTRAELTIERLARRCATRWQTAETQRVQLAALRTDQTVLEGQLARIVAERDAARDLVRTVDLYGTGYVWRDRTTGKQHLLNPIDVDVIIGAEHQTEFERLSDERDQWKATAERLRAERARRTEEWKAARIAEGDLARGGAVDPEQVHQVGEGPFAMLDPGGT